MTINVSMAVPDAVARSKVRLGYRGPEVNTLRGGLRAQGVVEPYTVADDSIFDQWLHSAVMDFQRKRGLQVDGIVGPATWSQLFSSGGGAARTTPTGSITPIGPVPGQVVGASSPIMPMAESKLPLMLFLAVGGVGLYWYLSKRTSKSSVSEQAMSAFAGLFGKKRRANRRSLRRHARRDDRRASRRS